MARRGELGRDAKRRRVAKPGAAPVIAHEGGPLQISAHGPLPFGVEEGVQAAGCCRVGGERGRRQEGGGEGEDESAEERPGVIG